MSKRRGRPRIVPEGEQVRLGPIRVPASWCADIELQTANVANWVRIQIRRGLDEHRDDRDTRSGTVER